MSGLIVYTARKIQTMESSQPVGQAILARWKTTSSKRKWWARQDSNLRPNRYERFALTN